MNLYVQYGDFVTYKYTNTMKVYSLRLSERRLRGKGDAYGKRDDEREGSERK